MRIEMVFRKIYRKLSVLILGLLFSSTLQAQDQDDEGAGLVKTNRCYTCHNLTEPLLGPPYVAIAARHGPKKEVMVDVLAEKIVLGGGGNWGMVPMVPNEHVSASDARKIAQWILNLQL